MFTFELGQTVYFIAGNKVHSRKITSRKLIENANKMSAHTNAQKNTYMTFGESGEMYSLMGYVLPADKIFATREELLASL